MYKGPCLDTGEGKVALGAFGKSRFFAASFWMPLVMTGVGTAFLVLPVRDLLMGGDDLSEMTDPIAAFLSVSDAVRRPQSYLNMFSELVRRCAQVTSLIYALIFASAHSEAQTRPDSIRSSLTQKANSVHLSLIPTLLCRRSTL